MNLKKILSIMLFGAMCVGFVLCKNDDKGSYKAMVIDSNLEHATAKLSATSGIAFADEVTLTVTPDGEWESEPTVDAVNAKLKSSTESNSVYKFVYTGFTGDAVFTVEGVSTAGNSGNGSGGGTTNPTTPEHNGHEYVDLGLPSGLLWATCNVGATAPEEYGNYYAWGETSTKSSYTESNYTYSSNSSTLPLSADAAHVAWGGDWRMPTLAEIDELNSNCTTKWTTDYNGTSVAGRIVTSKLNGNSIFLPAAGLRYDSSLDNAGSRGYFWSSSLKASYPRYAYRLDFYSDNYDWHLIFRYVGQSVRPVCSPK